MIKTSDWIVDMGPEGGAGGGTVVAKGTPEDVAANPDSYTGHFLAESLGVPRPAPKARKRTKGERVALPKLSLCRRFRRISMHMFQFRAFDSGEGSAD